MRLLPFGTGLAGGVAIAVAGYTAFWFVAAGEIENRIDDWVEQQRAQGVAVETENTDISGYPLRFSVLFDNPRVQNDSAGWTWEARDFRAEMRPWNFSKVAVVPGRYNAMRYFDGTEWREVRCQIDQGQILLTLDGNRRISNVTLDIAGITLDGLWSSGAATIERLRANGLSNGDTGEHNGEALKAAIEAENIYLPEGLNDGLGDNLAFLNFNVSLFGPLPDSEPVSIIRWRDSGGTVELNSFRIRWGPLGIESNGTLALDADLRPIGSLTADIIGYGDVIDALIMSNMIPLGDAFLAKVAFNMLAEKDENGGPPVLRSVPVTAQDGTVFVGPVKVAQVPAIARY